ncbi:hypothetical protein Q8F55_008488 [Vanrija albida]|uniref:F-box domain-containing protein n=1 Tax=Vanrija albida TaxID=181172 RepID=A0ABR3PQZ5_9TREE
MPPGLDLSTLRDPLAVFDDYALLEIFSHLDFHDIILSACNVSKRWRSWCERIKVCKRSLEASVYAVDEQVIKHRITIDGKNADDFADWRAHCLGSYKDHLAWKNGDISVQWSPEVLTGRFRRLCYISDVDPGEGTILRFSDDAYMDIIDEKSLMPIHSKVELWLGAEDYMARCVDIFGAVLYGRQETPTGEILVHLWVTERARKLLPDELAAAWSPRPPDMTGFQYLATFTLANFSIFQNGWTLGVEEVSPRIHALIVAVDDLQLKGVGSISVSRLATMKSSDVSEAVGTAVVPALQPTQAIPTSEDGLMEGEHGPAGLLVDSDFVLRHDGPRVQVYSRASSEWVLTVPSIAPQPIAIGYDIGRLVDVVAQAFRRPDESALSNCGSFPTGHGIKRFKTRRGLRYGRDPEETARHEWFCQDFTTLDRWCVDMEKTLLAGKDLVLVSDATHIQIIKDYRAVFAAAAARPPAERANLVAANTIMLGYEHDEYDYLGISQAVQTSGRNLMIAFEHFMLVFDVSRMTIPSADDADPRVEYLAIHYPRHDFANRFDDRSIRRLAMGPSGIYEMARLTGTTSHEWREEEKRSVLNSPWHRSWAVQIQKTDPRTWTALRAIRFHHTNHRPMVYIDHDDEPEGEGAQEEAGAAEQPSEAQVVE